MKLLDLPLEILIQVTSIIVSSRPRHILPLLTTNTLLCDLTLSVLHTHISFQTLDQLRLFHACHELRAVPKSLELTFAGGAADHALFPYFQRAVCHMIEILPRGEEEEVCENGTENRYIRRVLELQRLQLCLNSLNTDPNGVYLYEVLRHTNPEEFIWTGPDPGHHFSIAIVASSVFHIFDALAGWTKLRRLKLTNMAFPNASTGPNFRKMPPGAFCRALAGNEPDADPTYIDSLQNNLQSQNSMVKTNTTLQSIYIGRTTFLDPFLIAHVACDPAFEALTDIHVIDAYQGSIWGPRVRIGDIERASDKLVDAELGTSNDPVLNDNAGGSWERERRKERRRGRIRAIVKCASEKERIIGGDRMDGALVVLSLQD